MPDHLFSALPYSAARLPSRRRPAAAAAAVFFAVAAMGMSVTCPQAFAQAPSATRNVATALDHLYRVKAGDTPQSVASLMTRDDDWKLLLTYNGLPTSAKLVPGSTMRIPKGWMKEVPAQALLKAKSGRVEVDGKPAEVGSPIGEASTVSTGADGSATIVMGDGSLFSMVPSTRVTMESLRATPDLASVKSFLRLVTGQMTALVTKSRAGNPNFLVRTPTATAGVRGTHFRVGTDGQTSSRSEVLEGGVDFGGEAGSARQAPAVSLAPGFGSVAEAGKPTLPPVPLLPPVLAEVAWAGGEKRLYGLAEPVGWQRLEGARQYRAQVSKDADFATLLQDDRVVEPRLSLKPLPDGPTFVRVRGVDGLGLEGRDAVIRLVVKNEPVAPSAFEALASGKDQPVARIGWKAVAGARAYLAHVSASRDFGALLAERRIDATEMSLPLPGWGNYYFRVASVDGAGERGPFSSTQPLVASEPPKHRPSVTLVHHNATMQWQSVGQPVRLRVTDSANGKVVVETGITESGVTYTMPHPGKFEAKLILVGEGGKETESAESTLFTSPQMP
jgi:ferric-dicitrate binding protein FerR (iron transport regulator)